MGKPIFAEFLTVFFLFMNDRVTCRPTCRRRQQESKTASPDRCRWWHGAIAVSFADHKHTWACQKHKIHWQQVELNKMNSVLKVFSSVYILLVFGSYMYVTHPNFTLNFDGHRARHCNPWGHQCDQLLLSGNQIFMPGRQPGPQVRWLSSLAKCTLMIIRYPSQN